MFKSFFPKPGPFFLSAFIWALIAVIFWQAGGGAWLTRITGATGEVPISAARFWSLSYLLFYAYYMVCVGLFALFWFMYSPHRWQYWSILGTSLIIFVTWFLVEVGVAVNAWYAPFYDLIQTALSSPHKVTINQFYHEVGIFLGIALIAVIIGVTNIIPFFGPFIGAIPSGLLILLIDPLKALYFVLFILALQQFDGNILGPKILGDSTGLSSFWVMFAILLAGGLFGFVGMVVGVPLFAVLYSILSGLVCHSLRRRGMPEETQAYYELDHVDERTHDILYNEAPARPAAGSADRPE